MVLQSTSRAVQLDVFVTDSSGRPVHGLRKSDFLLTDNTRPRDIRIFSGEIDSSEGQSSAVTIVPPAVYSNRFGLRDSPIVTAIVIDAVPRPEGVQKHAGLLANAPAGYWFSSVRRWVIGAIYRMAPGQTIAIYAACPELQVVQDYTSDPGRLVASLEAFAEPPAPQATGRKQPESIDALVPPTLAVLRAVVGRMSAAPGRKSVVWISQAYGPDLNLSAIDTVTDATADAFNDANVPLYAVDARRSPTCQAPANLRPAIPGFQPADRDYMVILDCSQPPDISDRWMQYLAQATGGRIFRDGKFFGTETYDAQAGTTRREVQMSSPDGGLVTDALRFASDASRYAYEMGFYLPESELDGKFHTLGASVPASPNFALRYRNGYTASAGMSAPPDLRALPGADPRPQPAAPRHPDEVGIDARVELPVKPRNELQLSLMLAPETVTRTPDGVIALDATFTQTDALGKELGRTEDALRAPTPGTPGEMVRYARNLKRINGAVLLHITIRDPATNRAGSLAVPIGKQ
ncbi:MAG TPA: hypothetical protein VHW09_22535 [Bryobacteraceae bacterium]|jgi:hypothetical protein|nr:hypothetical protein [Bryobacteraceae bacterium]